VAQLENLCQGASVRGVLPDTLVTIVCADWFGSSLRREGMESAVPGHVGKPSCASSDICAWFPATHRMRHSPKDRANA